MKKCKEDKNRRRGLLDTAEDAKKKPDVITKARNKLHNLSDSLKSNKHSDLSDQAKKGINKSMTQVTLDCFFKHSPNKNHVYANSHSEGNKGKTLRKQNSIGSYPIRIEVTDEDDVLPPGGIDRLRPATVCVDKLDGPRDTEALALERPRKKLSFKVPEITGIIKKTNKAKSDSKDLSSSLNCIAKLNLSVLDSAGIPRNSSFNGVVHRDDQKWDDENELEVCTNWVICDQIIQYASVPILLMW